MLAQQRRFVAACQNHLNMPLRLDLRLIARIANGDDDLLDQRHVSLGAIILLARRGNARRWPRRHNQGRRRALVFGNIGIEMLPDLLGDERHERMQQPQCAIQRRPQNQRRSLGLRLVA